MERKLPIGIQSFEKLRSDNFLYIDKTEYIYQLAHHNVPYFLSRPRRFGKSLLLSAMKAYWEGKAELFADLAIEKLEQNNPEAWKTYPVFYFDFNGKNYQREGALEEKLEGLVSQWEELYQMSDQRARPLEERFQRVLRRANLQTGLRCVVLIDEYDKPLLDIAENPSLQQQNKNVFKGFFSTLKSEDEHIQYIFITGVTKFHKVSIFSDLNQLTDISMSQDYAALCGITETEISQYFSVEVKSMAARRGMREEECIRRLREQYDGYHFHPDGEAVYNPYSLMTALQMKEFGSYWFETGTPLFLVRMLRNNHFDVRKMTNRTLFASESVLKDYTGESLNSVPLLYQTGYLTIADYDEDRDRYTLCFPNKEVKYGFVESMIPAYVPAATAGNGLDIFTLDEYIENGQLDEINNVLTALFANITYTSHDAVFEHYFQTVIFLVFTMLGKLTQCEMHTFQGRIDCKVEARKYIYLFEFKRDDTAAAALEQINSREYSLPFAADQRKLFKIGVSFDSGSRRLVGWEVQDGLP